MEISEELGELVNQAEILKENIWHYMDKKRKDHKGVRSSMNELLNLIEEIDEYGEPEIATSTPWNK